ncbi:MAG: hypothetical protein MI724_16975, partial [Spirochaetales bacterium]|nr:hypothetical protein [Spirochaetales bacterium]
LEGVEEGKPLDESEEVEEEAVAEPEGIGAADAVDELDEIEEVESVEALEDVEEAEAVDELEEIPDAEAAAELDGIEELEDPEPAARRAEIVDHKPVVEADQLDEGASFDAPEDAAELAPIDELEEIPEVVTDETLVSGGELEGNVETVPDDGAKTSDFTDESHGTEYAEDADGLLAIGVIEGIDEEPFLGDIVVEEEIGPLVPESDWLAGQTARNEPESPPPVAGTPTDDAQRAAEPLSEDWLTVSTTPLELSEDDELVPEAAGGGTILNFVPSSPLEENIRTDGDSDEAVVGLLETDDDNDLEELELLEEIEEWDEPEPDAPELVEELAPIAAEDPLPVRDTVASGEVIEELDEVQFDSAEALPIEEVGEGATSLVSAFSSFGGASSIRDSLSSPTDDPQPAIPIRRDILPDEIVVRGIENTDTHHVMEIEDFFASAGRRRNVFEERDGLVQIQAAAYFAEYHDIDQRVQVLAEQILLHHDLSGIDDVLKAAFDDLDFDDIFDDAESVSSSAGQQDTALRVASGGFEFPIKVDSGNVGVRQVYRELVQITRRWNARVALVLDELTDGRMQGSFGIGLSEECDSSLALQPDCALVRNVIAFRRVALLKRPLSFFRDFADTCQASKLVSVNSWLLLPLRDTGARRYLMVGFSRPFDSLIDLTMRYDIVPRAV